jgi:hypothetical protein
VPCKGQGEAATTRKHSWIEKETTEKETPIDSSHAVSSNEKILFRAVSSLSCVSAPRLPDTPAERLGRSATKSF